jgi:hypothetical protein
MPLLQTDKLLAESQVLKQQVAARGKKADKEDKYEPQQAQHEVSIIRDRPFRSGSAKPLI